MSDLISKFTSLPPHGIGALIVLLLYAAQAQIRFGKRARAVRPGVEDRGTSLVVSISAAIPVAGFVLAMKMNSPGVGSILPAMFKTLVIPGMPAMAWIGVAVGSFGIALRLWAVLTLRERYTRTLLIQNEHTVERAGPYRRVRHPGYLASLLTLNGVALASGNWIVLLASLIATTPAYLYRIRVEDRMLVEALGQDYVEYQRQVRPLLPIPRQ